jgi:hypothetical protein
MSAAPSTNDLQKPSLSPTILLGLYLLALLPLIACIFISGAELIPILVIAVMIFGVSLIAASLHPLLGVIFPLAVGLFHLLNPISLVDDMTFWTQLFWSGLLIPFLLLVLPLQWKTGIEKKTWQRWLRVVFIGGTIWLGSLAAYGMHGTLPSVYWWSCLACVPALLWINSGGIDQLFDGAEGLAGVYLGIIASSATSWHWYDLLFSPDLAAWLNYLLRGLFTFAGFFLIFGISFYASRKAGREKPEIGLRRYFFFASFLILGVLYENLIQSLLTTILATVLYSLSYPVIGKFKKGMRPVRYPAVAIIAFPALFLAMVFFKEPSWFNSLRELVIFDIPITVGLYPFWVILIVALIFTISGTHWVTFFGALLVGISIISRNGFSNPSLIFIVVLVVGIGMLIGMRRILLSPLVSFYLPALARRIEAARGEEQQALCGRAAAILDWAIWPTPLGVQAILECFARAGATPKFESASIQKRFDQVQEHALNARILKAQSLQSALDLARGMVLNESTEGLRKALRVRGQFSQIRSLAEAIRDLQEKQTTYTDQQRHLTLLAYQHLHQLKVRYWELYQQIPELGDEGLDDFKQQLSNLSSPTQNLLTQESNQQITEIERLVAFLEALRPARNRLPVKEQTCFRVLLETGQEMNRLRREPDLQRRTEILQETMARITEARRKQEDGWLTVAPDADRVIEQPNPWLPYLNAVYTHLENLLALNEFYFSWANQAIVDVLNSMQAAADLARLNNKLALVTDFAVGYGGVLDQVLELLQQAGREASAALAFPRGFSRKIGLQDTLDLLNKLRSILSTRYRQETEALQPPLKRLTEMLLTEIHQVEVHQDGSGYRNPYLSGNPIRLNRAALFKGRQSLAQSIISMLRGGGRPTIILYGARRMGKTSFLLQLPRLLPGNFLPVFLDMQEGGAQQNDASFMYSIAWSIYRQLRADGRLARPNLADFEAHPYTTLTPWIEDEALPLLKDRILFITIDEFELIGSAIKKGAITDQVLGYLRHLMQHNENIVLLFAGVQTLKALGPNPASYFITANPIEMSYLDPQDAEELIRNPDPSAGAMPTYTDEVVAEILRVTHCQPYLIQAICSEIISAANVGGLQSIPMEVIDEAVKAVLTSSLYFQNIWDDSGPEGQELLRKLANGPQNLLTNEDLIKRLLHRRVIVRGTDGTCSIEIPMVQRWMKHSH